VENRDVRPSQGLRRTPRLFLAVAALLAVALAPGRASALETPFTAGRTQVVGGLRFGSDNLNLGLGVRGGYTLPMNVYIGGMFDYFFGESNDATVAGIHSTSSYNFWVLGAEGGYDFAITKELMVRPFGGLGIAHTSVEACTTGTGIDVCSNGSESDVGLLLGGLMNFTTGPLIMGPELRLLVYQDTAFVLGAHFGGIF